ncbi:hypothetical protein ACR777_05430 [Sphingobacterium spiritivorum]|uniref:hypothetical protein n=1 Tax=Sphingobacterium spiritivorum TaxID=258 RepID=UPI003DA49780
MVESILQIAGMLLTGGLLHKILDHFFLSKKDKIDANSKLIQQLQDWVFKLQEQVTNSMNRQNELQSDVDYWRREYNELHKENQNKTNENEGLRKEIDALKRQYNDLKKKYDQLIKKGDDK